MKPNRDANELAARLVTAASKPPPLPEAVILAPPLQAAGTVAVERPERAQPIKEKKTDKTAEPTVGITLRPSRALLTRYTLAAAERTRQEGRVVSAQEVMIQMLERGP